MAYDSDHALLCGCPACAGTLEPRAEVDTLVAGGSSEPAALPVSQAPTYAINGVVNEYHYQWGSYTPGTATTVTYSFLTVFQAITPPTLASASIRGDECRAEAGHAAHIRAFAELSNITFSRSRRAPVRSISPPPTSEPGSAAGPITRIRLFRSGRSDGDGRRLDHQPICQLQQPDQGQLEYLTIIHDIGHAIGLKHPGNYNAGGGGTGGPYLPTSEDSRQYTVMSYYSGPSYGSTEPITPQLYDIAAVQHSTASTARRGRVTTPMRSRRRCRSRPSGTAGEPIRSTCRTRRKPSSSICVPDVQLDCRQQQHRHRVRRMDRKRHRQRDCRHHHRQRCRRDAGRQGRQRHADRRLSCRPADRRHRYRRPDRQWRRRHLPVRHRPQHGRDRHA